jgi:hypothetical protein
MKNHFRSRFVPFPFTWVCASFLLSCSLLADNEVLEQQGIAELHVQSRQGEVQLSWPSHQTEIFIILCRTNSDASATWTVLSQSLHAARATNTTAFIHRPEHGTTNVYSVLVVPSFWPNLDGARLSGGPQNPGEDFIPFYYGTREEGILLPRVQLLVDGHEDPEDSGDKDTQQINVGTPTRPHWLPSTGFWFRHQVLKDGKHTLQLRALIPLNNMVGSMSQELVVSNSAVTVPVANSLSKPSTPDAPSWWDLALGRTFVRKRPSATERTPKTISGDIESATALPSRPLDVFH